MNSHSREHPPNTQLSVLLGLLLLFCAWVLAYWTVRTPAVPSYGTVSESGERLIFASLVLSLIPLGIAASWIVCRSKLALRTHPMVLMVGLSGVALVQLAIIVTLMLELETACPVVKVCPPLPTMRPVFLLVLALASTAAGLVVFRGAERPAATRRGAVLFLVAAAVCVFCTLSFRVFSAAAVGDSFAMTTHLEAVFYSVSQVSAGKSVLVNLPAQYGLYAEILNPIFQITGLSVLKFTMVMAVLELIATLAVLRVLFEATRLTLVRVVASAAFIAVVGYTWLAPLDPYFQYYPIRFFFPAIALALYWSHLKAPAITKVIALGVLSAIAVPFNLDSGIPVLGSCFAGFLFAAFFDIDRARKLRELAVFVVAMSLAAAGFIAAIYAKSGTPHWHEMVRYQELFYVMGMYMLPMARQLNYWMLIAGAYVVTILTFLAISMRNPPPRIWKMLFHASVLGLGLFSYFQGRSHIVVLMMASWPALLVLFVLTDRTLRAVRAGLLARAWRVVAFPPIVLGIFLAALLAFKIPDLARYATERLAGGTSTPVTRTIDFLKTRISHPGSMVIIAPHQAVYYAETGTASAINGPGVAENILAADRASFVDEVLTGQVEDVFYQADPAVLEAEYAQILDGPFSRLATSPDGMIHLRRKSQ